MSQAFERTIISKIAIERSLNNLGVRRYRIFTAAMILPPVISLLRATFQRFRRSIGAFTGVVHKPEGIFTSPRSSLCRREEAFVTPCCETFGRRHAVDDNTPVRTDYVHEAPLRFSFHDKDSLEASKNVGFENVRRCMATDTLWIQHARHRLRALQCCCRLRNSRLRTVWCCHQRPCH